VARVIHSSSDRDDGGLLVGGGGHGLLVGDGGHSLLVGDGGHGVHGWRRHECGLRRCLPIDVDGDRC
jgi:hypothetical protein